VKNTVTSSVLEIFLLDVVVKVKSYCCEEDPNWILETIDFQHIIIKEAYCLAYVIPLGQFV
jgi:hypothetical protein